MNWTLVLALVIGVLYPMFFVFTYKKTNSNIKKDGRFRLLDYKQTIFIFWLLTLLILVNFYYSGSPAINLVPNVTTISIILTVIVLVLSRLQYKQSTVVNTEICKTSKEKMGDVFHFLPSSKKEFRWFIFLSISAGICEEIIFRLFLVEFLKEHSHIIVAVIVANVIFAMTHIGSGKRNLLSSFILGLLFSAIYYFTDNIWIAILFHTAIDINAGVMGYKINLFGKANDPAY